MIIVNNHHQSHDNFNVSWLIFLFLRFLNGGRDFIKVSFQNIIYFKNHTEIRYLMKIMFLHKPCFSNTTQVSSLFPAPPHHIAHHASHIIHNTSHHISHISYHISRLTSHISHLTSHISHLTSGIPHPTCCISHLTSHGASHISHLTSRVFHLASRISHHTSHLTHHPSLITHRTSHLNLPDQIEEPSDQVGNIHFAKEI